jgi:hypothetical protein
MAFFFLPLAASVLQNYQAVSPVLFQVIAVCLISTLITFAVSYGTVRLLRSIMGGSLPPASTKTPDSAEAEFALRANSANKDPLRGFCSGTPLCGGTADPPAAPATPPDSAVDLTHKTTCSIRAGKNSEKTLVESVSAIYDTLRWGGVRAGASPRENACRTCLRYLQYAAAGNSKCFPGGLPRPLHPPPQQSWRGSTTFYKRKCTSPWYTLRWVKPNLCCEEEIGEEQQKCGSSLEDPAG